MTAPELFKYEHDPDELKLLDFRRLEKDLNEDDLDA